MRNRLFREPLRPARIHRVHLRRFDHQRRPTRSAEDEVQPILRQQIAMRIGDLPFAPGLSLAEHQQHIDDAGVGAGEACECRHRQARERDQREHGVKRPEKDIVELRREGVEDEASAGTELLAQRHEERAEFVIVQVLKDVEAHGNVDGRELASPVRDVHAFECRRNALTSGYSGSRINSLRVEVHAVGEKAVFGELNSEGADGASDVDDCGFIAGLGQSRQRVIIYQPMGEIDAMPPVVVRAVNERLDLTGLVRLPVGMRRGFWNGGHGQELNSTIG